MDVLVVDDEKVALDAMAFRLKEIPEIKNATYFQKPQEAYDWLKEHNADIAFLDIHMRGMDGLSLAKALREVRPQCRILFVTGYSEYALEAFRVHADGYLMKPVESKDIRQEIDYILSAHTARPETGKKLKVQCFGNFEAFGGGRPLAFERSKTKELLAYLVDRKGAMVSSGEMRGILWEEQPDSKSIRSQLRTLMADLFRTLHSANAEDVLIKQHNGAAIDPEKIDCDYYRFLKGDADAVNAYTGEYMSQYSWAEMTLSYLAMQNLHK